MQYNFQVSAALPDEDSKNLVSEVAEGLEASTELIVEIKVKVNTELPEEKIESLTDAVSGFVTNTLGVEATAQLISKEY